MKTENTRKRTLTIDGEVLRFRNEKSRRAISGFFDDRDFPMRYGMYFAGIATSVLSPNEAISSPDVERFTYHVPFR
jgi:hypothetical protein